MENIPLLLGWFAVFIFSATVHEAAHAWIAKIGGDPTAYHGGQVSLNPLPHMQREPFGMVLLPILAVLAGFFPFGYASAPYDLRWAEHHPRRAAYMAAAGPLSNLAVALLCLVMMGLGLTLGWFNQPQYNETMISQIVVAPEDSVFYGTAFLLSMLFSMNILLFVINILPVPPLDGAGILPLIMKAETARRYNEFVRQPWIAILGLIVVFKFAPYIYYPILGFFLEFLY